MKLWEGRFNKKTSVLLEKFNASIDFDKRLFKEDIAGSIAHSRMLAKQNIISNNEQQKIELGLKEIENKIETENFIFSQSDEDIHMAIERALIKSIGPVGGKLHTARSRNDQIVLDLKMFLKKESNNIKLLLHDLMKMIVKISKENKKIVMPGFTHLQQAQPILFSHYMLAYYEMFKRDYERVEECYERLDHMPLGACALAGTTYNIDREFVAEELGFKNITNNSIDSVSDRDFVIELSFVISMISMHLSRFSEEIILYSTSEFGYFLLDDAFSTGSSIMPQKKNPDIAELVRGKSARIFGNLISMLVLLKSLPLAYNKDLQEDKESIFDSIDTIKISLEIFTQMLDSIKINSENMNKSLCSGFINATDLADYLTKKGMPFRNAHKIIGNLVSYCEEKKILLNEISFEEYKKRSDLFEEDIYDILKIESCIKNRNSYGGTSFEEVGKQIKKAENELKIFN